MDNKQPGQKSKTDDFSNSIDFSDLASEVIDMWESDGTSYCYSNVVTCDPYLMVEWVINLEHQAILDDPMACIDALGFDSIANYLLNKQLEENA